MGKDESDDDTSTVSEDLCGIPDSTAEHNVIIQTQNDATPTEEEVALMSTLTSEKNLIVLALGARDCTFWYTLLL